MAGALLFALSSRACWSELSACLSLSTDKLEADGFIVTLSSGCTLISEIEEGGFMRLPMSSRMVSRWLQELLGKHGDPDLSTHSLKTSVLFWANAGGLQLLELWRCAVVC
eukprot:3655294-Amphidinium_carterae.1